MDHRKRTDGRGRETPDGRSDRPRPGTRQDKASDLAGQRRANLAASAVVAQAGTAGAPHLGPGHLPEAAGAKLPGLIQDRVAGRREMGVDALQVANDIEVQGARLEERQSTVTVKSVSVRVEIGGRRT